MYTHSITHKCLHSQEYFLQAGDDIQGVKFVGVSIFDDDKNKLKNVYTVFKVSEIFLAFCHGVAVEKCQEMPFTIWIEFV